MDLKEFRLSLLMLGWIVDDDSKYSIVWKKEGKTLQWDKQQRQFLGQLVHYEQPADAENARNILVRKGGSLAISRAFSSFAECIQEVSDE